VEEDLKIADLVEEAIEMLAEAGSILWSSS
jgi:hypothetical protein